MNVLVLVHINCEVFLKKARYECYFPLVIFDLYYIVLVNFKFTNWPAIGVSIWVWVKHVVAQQHVTAMVHVIMIWDVLVAMRLNYLSDKDANTHTSFDFGQSETHSLVWVFGDRVVGECESLISDRWLCLYGISSGHMYAFSLVIRAIDNEELEFEDSVDSLVYLF